jgi:hypothetical protein
MAFVPEGQAASSQALLAWAFAPKGSEDSAQGFNPGNDHQRRALKGRQIERTSHTKAGVIVNMSQCSLLSPLQGETY